MMRTLVVPFRLVLPLLAIVITLFTVDAHAAITNAGLLDNVLQKYQTAAGNWAESITNAASWLFWTLVVISMVWTFGMMALRKADIGEFFAEFTRFTIFTGFFWWILTNGPRFASSIYMSLRQLASDASGLNNNLSPSGIVDVGFAIFYKVLDQTSVWSPIDSTMGFILALGILVILSLVGVNMLLLLSAGWVLAYGGVFFLGFGGSRWTSDMAINYYKTVLGVAAQLFTMVLIVGIGKTFLNDYYAQMSLGVNLKELGVMLVVVVVLLALVNKVPGLIAGIITGASVGHAGIGNHGAGTAAAAASAAAAGVAAGAAMIGAGSTNIAGGTQALMAAISKANENVANGTDVLSRFGSGSGFSSNNSGGVSEHSTGGTPFAQAAGFSESTSGRAFAGNGKTDTAKTGSGKKSVSSDNQSGSNSGVMSKAGRIAADATANLAKGAATMMADKSTSTVDGIKEKISETIGGQLAAEINNPGAKTQERLDNQDIDKANAIKAAQARSIEAEQARQFLNGQSPLFEGNSLSGDAQDDPESEIAAFRDRDNTSSSL
jgi:type IV secretion system protein TrbL